MGVFPCSIILAILWPGTELQYSRISCSDSGASKNVISAPILETTTVFEDHCSPTSDTTIMSSIASGVDHIDHVKTQLPYTLLVGIVACIFGYLPAGLGLNPYISLAVGLAVLYLIVRFTFKKLPKD